MYISELVECAVLCGHHAAAYQYLIHPSIHPSPFPAAPLPASPVLPCFPPPFPSVFERLGRRCPGGRQRRGAVRHDEQASIAAADAKGDSFGMKRRRSVRVGVRMTKHEKGCLRSPQPYFMYFCHVEVHTIVSPFSALFYFWITLQR